MLHYLNSDMTVPNTMRTKAGKWKREGEKGREGGRGERRRTRFSKRHSLARENPTELNTKVTDTFSYPTYPILPPPHLMLGHDV